MLVQIEKPIYTIQLLVPMKNIDKFTNGEMSEAQEKKYIESLYEKHYDNKLKNDYKEKLALEYNISKEGLHISKKPQTNTMIKYIIAGISTVAAILTIVLVFLPMMKTGTSLDSQQFAQSLITIEKMDIKRGGQEDSQLRLDIIESFNSGNYDEALLLYDQLGESTSEDKYYKGRIYLYQKNYKRAIDSFKGISDPDTFKFNAELKYWLGVAYSASGDDLSAKPLLEEVAKSKWMSVESKELLGKIGED